jgi:prepilin-type N-terminal cleavage/methylation domain-containing protein
MISIRRFANPFSSHRRDLLFLDESPFFKPSILTALEMPMLLNNLRIRAGFTLIELLVVISIIGILVALLLPAVQAARESARRTQCLNYLKQIGLAFQTHHNTLDYFPTGGWGWSWAGDPDGGFDERQPGGWVYNILPFIEQQNLHDLGAGSDPTAKKAHITTVIQTPLQMMNCPTRRVASLLPQTGTVFNANPVTQVAKTDYSVNCGDFSRNQIDAGPAAGSTTPPATPSEETGISYRCSRVSFRHITDGTSYTLCVGEKYLAQQLWENGADAADNENMYVGYDNDISRSTNALYYPPMHDRPTLVQYTYGSGHGAGFQAVFCDGATRIITFDIDKEVFRIIGNRQDRKVVDPKEL